MALTPSTMIPLGSKLVEFSLPDANGKVFSHEDFKDAKALLVIFMCNHCPYVIHIADALAAFERDYRDKGVQVVGINSNDWTNPKYAGDSPENMLKESQLRGYEFPYLIDEDQSIAKAFDAACTPDLYLYDESRQLVYRGEFDPSRPSNGASNGSSLRSAVDLMLAGDEIPKEQRASMGCNIKWK